MISGSYPDLRRLAFAPAKSQRVPIHIPPNLTNEQIREFLAKDLSKSELKAVAAQRGISPGKRSDEEIRRVILRALERQGGVPATREPPSLVWLRDWQFSSDTFSRSVPSMARATYDAVLVIARACPDDKVIGKEKMSGPITIPPRVPVQSASF